MTKSGRPVLPAPLNGTDRLLEGIALLALILTIVLPVIYFQDIQGEVPSHYDITGEPDRYGGKNTIWIFPILGIVFYWLMLRLSRRPHLLNYPVKISTENAPKQYRAASRMIRVLNVLLISFLAWLTYSTIQTGLGNQNGLGTTVAGGFIGAVAGILVAYTIKARREA